MAVSARCTLVVLACYALTACTAQPSAPASSGSGAAPAFSFITFDGRQVALADFAGRGVVLNFWASWCVPCREEMPYFERVARTGGVALVGLALLDDDVASRAFINEIGISYPTGADPNSDIARSFQVIGLPTTIFIRPDGTIARKWPGPLSESQLQEFLRDIS
jgi:thiol-disulfide isomerase/thioredoxin